MREIGLVENIPGFWPFPQIWHWVAVVGWFHQILRICNFQSSAPSHTNPSEAGFFPSVVDCRENWGLQNKKRPLLAVIQLAKLPLSYDCCYRCSSNTLTLLFKTILCSVHSIFTLTFWTFYIWKWEGEGGCIKPVGKYAKMQKWNSHPLSLTENTLWQKCFSLNSVSCHCVVSRYVFLWGETNL